MLGVDRRASGVFFQDGTSDEHFHNYLNINTLYKNFKHLIFF